MVRGDPPPGVKAIRLVLHPATPPSQALRYPLLPELRQQKPGNAVPVYHKAAMTLNDAFANLNDKQWYDRVESCAQMPLDQLPREQMHNFLRPFEAALKRPPKVLAMSTPTGN